MNRHGDDNQYRYGVQRQERDDELRGVGNSLNFEYRNYDPRLCRFISVDPLEKKYPHNSPYAFSENVVIDHIELEGLEKANLDGTPAKEPKSKKQEEEEKHFGINPGGLKPASDSKEKSNKKSNLEPKSTNSNNTNITVKSQRTLGQATVGTINGEASATSIITKGETGFEQTMDAKTLETRSVGYTTSSGTKVSFSKSGDIKVSGEFFKSGSTNDGRLILEYSLGGNTKGNLTLKIDTKQINDNIDRSIQSINKIVNKSIDNMGKLSGALLSLPVYVLAL